MDPYRVDEHLLFDDRFWKLVQLRWTAQFLGIHPAGMQQGAEQLHRQHREHREHQHIESQGKNFSLAERYSSFHSGCC